MECFCGCCSKSKARRKEAYEQILKNEQIHRNTIRLLLLGSEESGQSTILKQLRILKGEGFSDEETRFQLEHIKKNIRDAILTIAGIMSTSTQTPHVALENQFSLDYIQNVASQTDFEFTPEFYEHTEKLWKDKGVQSCIIERCNEYKLTDSAKYFLDKVSEIKQPNYLPSEQDILRCRAPTCGVFESRFQMDGAKYHVFEIGGLSVRDRMRKWAQFFDDSIRAIIFVIDCSSFNTVLREDSTYHNGLQESLELFMRIWNNAWFRIHNINLILMLNKQDLLREKVKGGRWKLEDYFQDFAQYQLPADASLEAGDDYETIRAKYFIRDEFLRISKASLEYSRACRPIFTCALETGNIRRALDDCDEFVRSMELGRYSLIYNLL